MRVASLEVNMEQHAARIRHLEKNRPADGSAGHCSHCDREMPDGPDVCIGLLPDVSAACCGHGWVEQPYVLFKDGRRLEAREAIRWFAAAGTGPPPVDTVTVRLFEQYDGRLVVTAEYAYGSLRLIAVRWTNESDTEPICSFDGMNVRLARGHGLVTTRPGSVCSENPNGTVRFPIGTIETMAYAG